MLKGYRDLLFGNSGGDVLWLRGGEPGLVPSTAEDPFPGRCRLRRRLHALLDLRERRRAPQVHLEQRQPSRPEVAVRVVHPGGDEPAAQVDDASAARGGNAHPGLERSAVGSASISALAADAAVATALALAPVGLL